MPFENQQIEPAARITSAPRSEREFLRMQAAEAKIDFARGLDRLGAAANPRRLLRTHPVLTSVVAGGVAALATARLARWLRSSAPVDAAGARTTARASWLSEVGRVARGIMISAIVGRVTAPPPIQAETIELSEPGANAGNFGD